MNKKAINYFYFIRDIPLNKWDGKSNTKIAVKPVQIFPLQKSEKILNDFGKEENILKDLKINSKFY